MNQSIVVPDYEIYKTVGRLREGLRRHPALAHRNQDGSEFHIDIRRDEAGYVDVDVLCGAFLLVGIDVSRMWHFDLSALDRPAVLRHLSNAVGSEVRYWSDRGDHYYAIAMSESANAKASKLPESLALPRVPACGVFAYGLGSKSGPLRLARKDVYGLMVAGAPRTGKSTFLRMLAYQAVKQGWKIYAADIPSGNTFASELWRVASGVERIALDDGAFDEMVEAIGVECERRADLFRAQARGALPPEDLEAYNALPGVDRLPYLLLIADEFNSYKPSRQSLAILRAAPKYGTLMVFGAHSWRASAIPSALAELMRCRLSFGLTSDKVAEAVLPDYPSGRHHLLRMRQPGRALTNLNGVYEEVQCYFVRDDELMSLAGAPADATLTVKRRAPVLSQAERAIAEAVVERLGGMFSVDRLRSLGVASDRQIRNASTVWASESHRWLGDLVYINGRAAGRPLTEQFYADTGIDQRDRDEPFEDSNGQGDQGDQPGQGDQAQQTWPFPLLLPARTGQG